MDVSRIIVLGGGMAGLAAARRLSLSGHDPLLIAPDHKIPNRGETLSPEALPILEKLDWSHLLDDKTALAGEDRFSVWGDPALRRSPSVEPPGHHIDRAALETEMAYTLSGVEHLFAKATGIEHRPDGVAIKLDDGQTIEAPALIDCTGRTAITSGNRRRTGNLVCAWQVFDLPGDAETLAATLIEAVETGWWYASPMPGNRLMAGLFTDSDLLPPGLSRDGAIWTHLLAGTDVTCKRLESLGLLGNPVPPPQIAPATTIVSENLLQARILRAGDAAAALDPLAANGLATALWSGMTAAHAAQALIAGDPSPARAYEYAFLEGIAGQLSGQHALYTAERRFPASPFWNRRC